MAAAASEIAGEIWRERRWESKGAFGSDENGRAKRRKGFGVCDEGKAVNAGFGAVTASIFRLQKTKKGIRSKQTQTLK